MEKAPGFVKNLNIDWQITAMGDKLKFGGLSNSRSLRTSPLKWCGNPPVRRTASRGRIPENGTKTTVCMTISRLEFDGDSHESSAHWFLNDSVVRGVRSPLQIPIYREAAFPRQALFCHFIRKKSGAADLPPLIRRILLESAAKRHHNCELPTAQPFSWASQAR